MGKAVETGCDLAILTNDNPRTEDPSAIIADILDGFERPADAQVIPDRADAIRRALASAAPGDCVLIAGKGHEHYQIIGHERIADGRLRRSLAIGCTPIRRWTVQWLRGKLVSGFCRKIQCLCIFRRFKTFTRRSAGG